MANSAFLANGVGSLGTELDDGLRIGPVNNRIATNLNGQITSANPYNQWGRGLLLSAANTYNIVPRGGNTPGNVVGLTTGAAPIGSEYLTLTADGYITSSAVASSGNTITGGSLTYLQLDWPRALSITTATTGGSGVGTITIFGKDYYGASMQESKTIATGNNTYQMNKAFYQITNGYYNGTGVTGSIKIQTTDVFGLPYAISSFGDVQAISWGNQSELMGATETTSTVAGSSPTAGATMVTGAVTIGNAGVQAGANIQLAYRQVNTAAGFLRNDTITPGATFTVESSAGAADVSSVYYAIMPQNWPQGSATLVAGTVFVSCPQVNANSVIQLSYQAVSGTQGFLSAPSASIIPGVGFTINSTSNTDTATVAWTLTQQANNITQGVGQFVNGVATILTSAATAQFGQIVLMTYQNYSNSVPGTNANLYISNGSVAGTSIRALSLNLSTTNVNDQSTFYWTIIPLSNQYINGMSLVPFTTINPLGTFTPADSRTATATTGDVRGTYLPSTPADGGKELHFTYFVHGYDNFQDQQASNGLPAGGTSSSNLVTRSEIGIADQVGVTQYYTGVFA